MRSGGTRADNEWGVLVGYVLAVYCGHDANIALVGEGKIWHFESERFSRKKHDGWPPEADKRNAFIRQILDFAGVHEDELLALAGVGCGDDWGTQSRISGRTRESVVNLAWENLEDHDEAVLLAGGQGRFKKDHRLFFVPHHLAHAGYAFYTSPYEAAQVIGTDGGGDAYRWPFGELVVVDTGVGCAKHRFGESEGFWNFEYDPGQHIGGEWGKFAAKYFNDDYGAGQVMALVGIPENMWSTVTALPPELRAQVIRLQWMTNISFHQMLVRGGPPNVAMAGGVSLNGIAAYTVLNRADIDSIHIPPACHDGGLAIGAALYALHKIIGVPRVKYAPDDIAFAGWTEDALCDDPNPKLAENIGSRIADGQVVAVARGRAESGPRALGHRSFLADPRNLSMKDRMNRLKGRHAYRPVAPVVLREYAEEYFDVVNPSCYHYMTTIAEGKDRAKAEAPAGLHYDGTARLQIVEKGSFLGQIVEAFRQRTGVPILLNTSFNLSGESMVNTAEHALSTFRRSSADALLLGGEIVE